MIEVQGMKIYSDHRVDELIGFIGELPTLEKAELIEGCDCDACVACRALLKKRAHLSVVK